jgi:hypothetical protein
MPLTGFSFVAWRLVIERVLCVLRNYNFAFQPVLHHFPNIVAHCMICEVVVYRYCACFPTFENRFTEICVPACSVFWLGVVL